MLYGNYQFNCRFETDAILPYYKGSTFRGVFGHALKKIVCALKSRECADCLLKEKCLYSLVFEPPAPREPGTKNRISADPHPFVIEPPLEPKTVYRAGAGFACNLLLFGEFNNKLPYFVYAFEQMGKIGIGKRVGGKRGAFVLERVSYGTDLVYAGNGEKIDMPARIEVLSVQEASNDPTGPGRIDLTLETPLRFKFNGRLADGLPFHLLVRAMLRRMSALMNAFGDGEPDLDYKGLVDRARHVRTAKSDLRWFDWERFSNRQDQRLLMGGITGRAVYEGELGAYLPLLDFCTRVHIGKNTSFGLGKVQAKLA